MCQLNAPHLDHPVGFWRTLGPDQAVPSRPQREHRQFHRRELVPHVEPPHPAHSLRDDGAASTRDRSTNQRGVPSRPVIDARIAHSGGGRRNTKSRANGRIHPAVGETTKLNASTNPTTPRRASGRCNARSATAPEKDSATTTVASDPPSAAATVSTGAPPAPYSTESTAYHRAIRARNSSESSAPPSIPGSTNTRIATGLGPVAP